VPPSRARGLFRTVRTHGRYTDRRLKVADMLRSSSDLGPCPTEIPWFFEVMLPATART
jgi:hypothetical protein